MAMGKRPAARQASPMWVDTADLPTSDGHPYFERLNRVLADSGFDAFVEELCAAFYADRLGRPSLRPGRYFRMLFIGYFEGLTPLYVKKCLGGSSSSRLPSEPPSQKPAWLSPYGRSSNVAPSPDVTSDERPYRQGRDRPCAGLR